MKRTPKPILTILACMLCMTCGAWVVVDSVVTTASTCPNNGSLAIYARSSDSSLLYSIIDGPITIPTQSNNTFNSLPPGVYQLLITNFSNDTALKFATVYGNYQYPAFTAQTVNPTCSNGANGQLTATTQAGQEPYVWSFTNHELGTTTSQSSPVFNNLDSGTYTIQLTDACHNTTTHSVTLQSNNTGMYVSGYPQTIIYGCYNTRLIFNINQIDNSPLLAPLTITISTRNGTVTRTANLNGNTISENVGGISYGDTVNMIIKNTCGDSVAFTHYIVDFSFYPNIVIAPNQCTYQTISSGAGIANNTVLMMPVHYTLRDSVSHNIVESNTVSNISSFGFSPHPGNRFYILNVTDSCGATYTTSFFWPAPAAQPQPSVVQSNFALHCLDSTAGIVINCQNFLSSPTLRLLGGPEFINSSKPGYTYHDYLGYHQAIQPFYNQFYIHNLTVGTYLYEVRDNCGVLIRDSFTITSAMLGDDNYSIQYIKGCPGENKLICRFYTNADSSGFSHATGNYTVRNIHTGNVAANSGLFYYDSFGNPSYSDTTAHLDAGTYEVSISYNSAFGPPTTYHPNLVYDCWTIVDTIVIPPYHRPQIQQAIKLACHGNSFIELHADSASGIAPYTYEIIAGPQTMPAQTTNTFTLNTTGTYLARITDACGTANTTSFSVDTASFPPISKYGSSCTGGTTLLTYQSSPYLTYLWKKPNGTTYIGDTLILSPTTIADTGTYTVTKIVSVNGCVDSFTAYYNLQQNTIHYVYDTICHGSGYTLGSRTYYNSGTYRDTLYTSGCDSIIQLNLQVLYQYDTVQQTLCPQQIFTLNGKNYSNSGVYYDTIIGAGCDTILVIDLHYNSYSYGSQLVTNCPGNTYMFNGRPYNQSGIYRDTLTTTGCDSIDILYLDVPEIVHEVYYDTICSGETYPFGAHYYSYSGIYNDTIPDRLCYKTRELNLYVAEPPIGDTAEQTYTVQFYDSVTLNTCIPGLTYRWNYGECSGCSTVTFKPTEEYNYYCCQAINEFGCIATCHYTVMIEGIYGNVFVPNVFTPNADGNNDEFRLLGSNIRFHNMQVFNRWGEKIFDTDNQNNGWDGTYKGEPQPAGVYIYVVKYSPLYNAENRNINGSVTLLR